MYIYMCNKFLFSIFWLFSFIFFDFHSFSINTEGIFLFVAPIMVYTLIDFIISKDKLFILKYE